MSDYKIVERFHSPASYALRPVERACRVEFSIDIHRLQDFDPETLSLPEAWAYVMAYPRSHPDYRGTLFQVLARRLGELANLPGDWEYLEARIYHWIMAPEARNSYFCEVEQFYFQNSQRVVISCPECCGLTLPARPIVKTQAQPAAALQRRRLVFRGNHTD